MNNGIITLDSNRGKQFGFTSDLFDGYLWKEENSIIISTIRSLQEGKGHLRALFDQIVKQEYNIVVPTFSPRMKIICWKYKMKYEVRDTEQGPCGCMVFNNSKLVKHE